MGIALALYAPIGLLLLLRGRPRLAVAGTLVVAGATLLPDVDSSLPWFVHRGRTHTVWFALAVGASLGVIAALVGGVRHRDVDEVLGPGTFGFVVGTIAVLAHLLGDVITPMGVRPLYPLSEAGHTFSLVLASDPAANARLFALGCLATVVQFAVGVGLGPGTPGRSTVVRATRRFAGVVRIAPRGAEGGKPGPVVADPSSGHAESGHRVEHGHRPEHVSGVESDD